MDLEVSMTDLTSHSGHLKSNVTAFQRYGGHGTFIAVVTFPQVTGHNEMAQNFHNGGFLSRPFLDLVVNRRSVLEDSLRQLRDLPPLQLKKRLKVSFLGEEGDDEGGVRKVSSALESACVD